MSNFRQSQKSAVSGVTPGELKDLLHQQQPPLLIDVRDPWEYEQAHIEGALLLPLDELYAKAPDLPHERELIVYCHHGTRSAAAAQLLMKYNYANVKNLLDGIHRWALEIDPTMPRY